MQKLAPNNDKVMKVKYISPKTRKELGLPAQPSQKPYTKKMARYAYGVAYWKAFNP